VIDCDFVDDVVDDDDNDDGDDRDDGYDDLDHDDDDNIVQMMIENNCTFNTDSDIYTYIVKTNHLRFAGYLYPQLVV
jgi:hypothetical protein